jgi:hypothetical protein
MEKRLLVAFTIALCAATGLEAARTVTVPHNGPKIQKNQAPINKISKEESSSLILKDTFSTAREGVWRILNNMHKMGLSFSTSDQKGLITMINALITGKLAGIHLQNKNANDIYAIVKNAINQVQRLPKLSHAYISEASEDFAHQIMGMLASHDVNLTSAHISGKEKSAKGQAAQY